jgi:lipid II:glycine glycyltransferase (peptidoglycan interpeptide bridge formation enzyme)
LIDNGYEWLDNTTTQLPCTHVLKLEKPFKEKIWMGLWSSKLRQQIRHARKSHIEIIIDDEFKYLNDFVDMHYQTIHKFGLIHGKEEVLGYINFFKGKIKLFICLLDSKPISAVLCFYTPTTAHQLLAPYNLKAKDHLTNTLPVCASIRYACEHGYTYYDMGITRTETLAEYKEKFGATRIPLREYTKTFSHFKVSTNDFYESIKRRGSKMIGSLKQ